MFSFSLRECPFNFLGKGKAGFFVVAKNPCKNIDLKDANNGVKVMVCNATFNNI
jgi:hypothetical protein